MDKHEISKDLLVAVDRSKGEKLVYSLIVVRLERHRDLMRYAGAFEHVKELGRRRKRSYLPKALKKLENLLNEGIVYSADVAVKQGVLLSRLESIKDRILIAVVDDKLMKMVREKLDLEAVTEGELTKRRIKGIYLTVLKVMMNQADTLAHVARVELERGKRLKEIRSKLPVRWRV